MCMYFGVHCYLIITLYSHSISEVTVANGDKGGAKSQPQETDDKKEKKEETKKPHLVETQQLSLDSKKPPMLHTQLSMDSRLDSQLSVDKKTPHLETQLSVDSAQKSLLKSASGNIGDLLKSASGSISDLKTASDNVAQLFKSASGNMAELLKSNIPEIKLASGSPEGEGGAEAKDETKKEQSRWFFILISWIFLIEN